MNKKCARIIISVAAEVILLLQNGGSGYAASLSSVVLISDVLTLSDGQRFAGLMSIVPVGFEKDSTPPSIVIPVKEQGMFEVRLPSTPQGASYSVHFQANATTSWIEQWIVPNKGGKLLRLADVRKVESSSNEVSDNNADRALTATVSLPIAVSDVTGLSDQLSSLMRSLAAANSSITSLTSLVNTLNSSATTIQVRGEVPTGSINGSNGVFTLASNPVAGSAVIYRNGVRLSLNVDYTLNNNTITFINGTIPQRGDVLAVDYVKSTM